MIEPTSLALIALNYTGSIVLDQIAGEATSDVWKRLKEVFRRKFSRDPDPTDLQPGSSTASEIDRDILAGAEALFSSEPTLRRVRMVAKVFDNARILWVDDNPKWNTYEAGFLRQLGSVIDQVLTTEEAVARYRSESFDLVISDMNRAGNSRAGLELLSKLSRTAPVIFFVGNLDGTRDRPLGSLGIVARRDDLFHLIMDALERVRS
jgi:CheY-like chemotaxis protein